MSHLDGREVSEFSFSEGNSYLSRHLPEGHKFVAVTEFWGDYELVWVVRLNENNQEVVRYNMKMLAIVRWKEPK